MWLSSRKVHNTQIIETDRNTGGGDGHCQKGSRTTYILAISKKQLQDYEDQCSRIVGSIPELLLLTFRRLPSTPPKRSQLPTRLSKRPSFRYVWFLKSSAIITGSSNHEDLRSERVP